MSACLARRNSSCAFLLSAGLPFKHVPKAPLIVVPGTHTSSEFAQCSPLFSVAHRATDRCGDRLRDLILDFENIRQLAVIAFNPHMVAGLGVYKLGGHANAACATTDATFYQIADTQFLCDSALRQLHARDKRSLSFVLSQITHGCGKVLR